MAASQLPHVCLPINLDAFVLNEKVCNEGDIRIAPITVPDYASLRLDSAQVQHDILPRIDLHDTQPATSNPRVSNMFEEPFVNVDAQGDTHTDVHSVINRARLGVYIHWSLPRAYRSAKSAATPPPKENQSGDAPARSSDDSTNPTYHLVPNRWLVVRILRSFKTPDGAPANIQPPTVASWIIESDRMRTIDKIDDFNNNLHPSNDPSNEGNQLPIDIESDLAPFVAFNDGGQNQDNILSSQTDKYLGYKVPLGLWSEKNLAYPDRIKLTTMNSSNPLFADYAIHNPNVFSTNDNFFYGFDQTNNPLFLTAATCDYIVVGWHSSAGDDPLGALPAGGAPPVELATRLQKLFCAAPSWPSDDADHDPAKNKATTRLICHGAKYTVVYNQDRPNTPADNIAARFKPVTSTDPSKPKDFGMEPIAVGTSPLDSVLAFFSAHQDQSGDLIHSDDPDWADDQERTGAADQFEKDVIEPKKPDGSYSTPSVAQTLMRLRELLYASEDDYNANTKASDLIYTHNYGRSPGGFIWKYDKTKTDENAPVQPSSDDKAQLRLLNEYQHAYDAANLKLTQLRWAIFAEFFKYVSDPSSGARTVQPGPNPNIPRLRKDMYSSRANAEVKEARLLTNQMNAVQNGINRVLREIGAGNVKKVAREPFFLRKDPNLCIAGIDAGWDNAYLNTTPTRYADRLNRPVSVSTDISKVVSTIASTDFGSDNDSVKATVTDLVREASGGMQTTIDKTTDTRVPLLGFKTWSQQPFCPQFIEWEAEYYHIPWECWDVENAYSALSSSNHTQVGYVNTTDLSKLTPGWLDSKADTRHVSGRMLVLPQPSFSFGAVVGQVIDAAKPSDLPQELSTKEQRTAFVELIKTMPFISGQLAGLTDALLTMANGQHVKPLVRPNGAEPIVMQEAKNVWSKCWEGKQSIYPELGGDDLAIIKGETGRTPYGNMVNFASDVLPPFKGVQHGQFAITSLRLVDKFGQVIALPTPTHQTVNAPSITEVTSNYVHPCLSEQLIPSVVLDGNKQPISDANGNKILNTVFNPSVTLDHVNTHGVPMTPFMELTPSINQDARINMDFLVPAPDATGWLPAAEWDNPIFGWVIVNYADSSLQFFTGEGFFFVEVQFGGPNGTIYRPRPFDPPVVTKANRPLAQLQEFVEMLCPTSQPADEQSSLNDAGLKSASYLKALFQVIVAATPSMPFPPSEYAQYANAIMGKPLALVNVGLSLELAQPPYWAQHTIPEPRGDPSDGVPDPLRVDAETTMSSYEFKVKLGDAERPFDGLVAYWDPARAAQTPGKKVWDDLYTYFPGDEKDATDCRKYISPESFPMLTPQFFDPSPSLSAYAYKDDKEALSYTNAAMATTRMSVFPMLIDPYTAIHAYSGILPIKSIQLAKWTISQALKNMTAFFAVGPILLTKDVPRKYNDQKPLNPDTWLNSQGAVGSEAGAQPPIKLPIAGGKGDWNWLQPYVTSDAKGKHTSYNALVVGSDDGHLRYEPAPYTFVEGYLQLARPLQAPAMPK